MNLPILVGALLFIAVIGLPTESNAPTIEYVPESGLVFVQKNSIQAMSSAYFPNPQVYGMVIGQEISVDELRELIKKEKPLLYRIIECESNWRNVCNTQGCGRGMGPAQIIPETWEYVKTKIRIGNDPMNEIDNLKAALWLFNNEGAQHWGYPTNDPRGYVNGERWGSWNCWAN